MGIPGSLGFGVRRHGNMTGPGFLCHPPELALVRFQKSHKTDLWGKVKTIPVTQDDPLDARGGHGEIGNIGSRLARADNHDGPAGDKLPSSFEFRRVYNSGHVPEPLDVGHIRLDV